MRRFGGVGVGDGDHVRVRVALRVPDHDRGQIGVSLGAGDGDHVDDGRRLDPPRLAAEPAALRDVAEEDALEPVFRCADQR